MTVMRSSGRFRMILNTKSLMDLMANPLNCLIVEIHVSYFNIIRQSGCIDSKAMVLLCNFHFSGSTVQHRLIGSAMPEPKLVRLASEGQTQ